MILRNALAWHVTVALATTLGACGGPSVDEDAGVEDASMGDAAVECSGAADCIDGTFCNGVERCVGGACMPSDGPACAADMECDEAMDRCGTPCEIAPDRDGDGHDRVACSGDDCDDDDANRFPGNAEVCDDANHDEDCAPATYGTRDIDGDGFVDAACCNADDEGALQCGTDCNDAVRSIQPGASEVCDVVDNNCDGSVDEGVAVDVYPDADYDGHGDASAAVIQGCAGRLGFSEVADDCDDAAPNRHPGLLEACDSVDNDCDDMVDDDTVQLNWYADADGDGYGDLGNATFSCAPPSDHHVLTPLDCDDTSADVFPGATEMCDGIDNDCNGSADFRISITDTEDDDLDGHGDMACGGDDCEDGDSSTYGGAPELCDHRDNDCDGDVDDGTAIQDWFPDQDGDGYGATGATPIRSCPPVVRRVPNDGDCDDTNDAIDPEATEVCDAVDDDCDGEAPVEDADGDGLALMSLACTVTGATPLPRRDCDDSAVGFSVGDWAHCGTCGSSCGAQQSCIAGACAPARRVFLTSTGHDGNFGGLAGADAFCQTQADAASLGGTWKAYMRDGSVGLERLEHPDVPFVRLDGVRIADNWADLSDGSIQVALQVCEDRQVRGGNVWTGFTEVSGGTNPHCDNWTYGGGGCLDGSACGSAGESYKTNSHWDGHYVFQCQSGYRVYCIEQ